MKRDKRLRNLERLNGNYHRVTVCIANLSSSAICQTMTRMIHVDSRPKECCTRKMIINITEHTGIKEKFILSYAQRNSSHRDYIGCQRDEWIIIITIINLLLLLRRRDGESREINQRQATTYCFFVFASSRHLSPSRILFDSVHCFSHFTSVVV